MNNGYQKAVKNGGLITVIINTNLTPAIIEDQATKIWTWGNLLHAKLKYL